MRLCYRECPADPVRVESGDCEGTTTCVPGAIQEAFSVEFKCERVPPPEPGREFPDACKGGGVDYAALARWVSCPCPKPAKDPCITLANIRVRKHPKDRCQGDDIDITVRPIVFSNELLFNLIRKYSGEEPASAE